MTIGSKAKKRKLGEAGGSLALSEQSRIIILVNGSLTQQLLIMGVLSHRIASRFIFRSNESQSAQWCGLDVFHDHVDSNMYNG
jgi:hypothetical protein